MRTIVIEGGVALSGEIFISGAKNAALPLMAACILADNPTKLHNVPNVLDVLTMQQLLQSLGLKTHLENNTFTCDGTIKHTYVSHQIAGKMRASFLSLGPLLSRYKSATVALPGGCVIGERPVNFHLEGLSKMGADIEIKDGYVNAKTKTKLKGCNIQLPQVSVGATQNILMAACLASGETTIQNAAQEPEILDLIHFLQKMGANIDNSTPSSLRITGVKKLGTACSHTVMVDRIEAATYCIAAAITNGGIILKNLNSDTLHVVIKKFREIGISLRERKNNEWLVQRKQNHIQSSNIITSPYPGFPSDLQAQMTALLSIADGISSVHETLFEKRFLHILELNKMGANIRIKGNAAIVNGVNKLHGCSVKAKDLRGAASLVLAGLAAHGKTSIHDSAHLDRGYDSLISKLKGCGARISVTEVKT